MYKEFKSEVATVRVFGLPNQEAIKKATVEFMKGVTNEEKKNKSKTA